MAHDLAASVRARLLNIAKAEQTDFNSVLVAFLKKNVLPAVPLTSASTPLEPIQQKYGSQNEPYWLECGS
ncbi:MAG: hypothetical protein D4R79_06800 [Comamonadaceae bacterium]|nr:MAG: hypothetical protein D4R79_06800 [Comamonadaceae bacterium]